MPDARATAVKQTVWGCKYSRHGHRLHGVPDSQQPEAVWVCVRTGGRRNVGDEDCVDCPKWEEDTDITPCP